MDRAKFQTIKFPTHVLSLLPVSVGIISQLFLHM